MKGLKNICLGFSKTITASTRRCISAGQSYSCACYTANYLELGMFYNTQSLTIHSTDISLFFLCPPPP